ncbi:MAG: hypothetical protein VYA84_21645 [Planctomycetota bacterium]|nr:hypothetical protein [Planctomycetota bacterium]
MGVSVETNAIALGHMTPRESTTAMVNILLTQIQRLPRMLFTKVNGKRKGDGKEWLVRRTQSRLTPLMK